MTTAYEGVKQEIRSILHDYQDKGDVPGDVIIARLSTQVLNADDSLSLPTEKAAFGWVLQHFVPETHYTLEVVSRLTQVAFHTLKPRSRWHPDHLTVWATSVLCAAAGVGRPLALAGVQPFIPFVRE